MTKQQHTAAIRALKRSLPYRIEQMLYQAYTTSKQFPSLLSPADCDVDLATFDGHHAFCSMNDRLDKIQDAGKRFAELSRSMEFMSVRVYVNAMGYVAQMLKRARLPALKGDARLREACAARDALRERLNKLDKLAGGSLGAPVPKGGNTAREVASELLALTAYGHLARVREGADSAALYGALFVARLSAEELLTALGDLDAPPLILRLRTEQSEMYKLVIAQWRVLREQVRPLCNDAEFERMAPWI